MKRLMFGYLGAILLVFLLPFLFSSLQFDKGQGEHSEQKQAQSGMLPKEISLYVVSEDAVRQVNFEEYIMGVIPAEMPAQFHEEALKAQAVAARTYAFYKYQKFTADESLLPPEHKGAVLCTDPAHCAAYYTKEQLAKNKGQSWMKDNYDKFVRAVDQTRGEVMVYEQEPILAAFHSSSGGGKTENSGEVWATQLPYLTSVSSQGEDRQQAFITTVAVSKQDFQKKIKEFNNSASFDSDPSKWIGDTMTTQGGAVKRMEVGGVSIKGTEMRSLFGLRSAQFGIAITKDDVVFTVEGSGHGVGMSQYGADYMASQGSNYQEILKKYYQGVDIVS